MEICCCSSLSSSRGTWCQRIRWTDTMDVLRRSTFNSQYFCDKHLKCWYWEFLLVGRIIDCSVSRRPKTSLSQWCLLPPPVSSVPIRPLGRHHKTSSPITSNLTISPRDALSELLTIEEIPQHRDNEKFAKSDGRLSELVQRKVITVCVRRDYYPVIGGFAGGPD